MKKLLPLLFSVLFISLPSFAQVSLGLQKAIQENQKYFQVNIFLSDRVDLSTLEKSFDRNNLHPDDRARIVYRKLKQKANQSQNELLNYCHRHFTGESQLAITDRYWLVNMVQAEVNQSAIQQLEESGLVYFMQLVGEDSIFFDKPIETNLRASAAPNGTEPGLEAIGAPALWEIGYSGLGQLALIFDSGIVPEHPAVGDRFLYFNKPGEIGWQGIDSYIPKDRPGNHGTHVTGTVLGLDRNTEDTIGVAFNARFMSTDPILDKPPYRKMSDYVGYYQFYFNPDGDTSTFDDVPDVINNSWGLFSLDTSLCTNYAADMAEAISTAGIALVFSAGNNGPGEVTIGRPAFINVNLVTPFAVGAVNGNDTTYKIASFSSRGPSICPGTGSLKIKPEVSAPGVSVRSAFGTDAYDLKSGTSMAAPHVSGAVLLLKEAFPFLTGKEILEALYFSAIDLGIPGEDNTYGMGIINLPAAFNYLSQTHTPVPPKKRVHDLVITDIQIPEMKFYCEDSLSASIFIQNMGDSTAHQPMLKLLNGKEIIDSFALNFDLLPDTQYVVNALFAGIEGNKWQEYGARIEWSTPVEEYDAIDNQRYVRFYSRTVDEASLRLNTYTTDSLRFKEGYFVLENPDGAETWQNITLENDSTNKILLLDCSTYLPRNGQSDMIYSPMYQTQGEGYYFSMKYAYATKSTLFADSLIVEYSTDCGVSFDNKLFAKAGQNLVTYSDVSREPEAGEWVRFDTTVTDTTVQNIIFRIRGVNDYGGKIYIDEFIINTSTQLTGIFKEIGTGIKLYPNPAINSLRIVSQTNNRINKLKIMNAEGRLIRSLDVNDFETMLDISGLNTGIYFVQIESEKGVTTKKFLKVK